MVGRLFIELDERRWHPHPCLIVNTRARVVILALTVGTLLLLSGRLLSHLGLVDHLGGVNCRRVRLHVVLGRHHHRLSR